MWYFICLHLCGISYISLLVWGFIYLLVYVVFHISPHLCGISYFSSHSRVKSLTQITGAKKSSRPDIFVPRAPPRQRQTSEDVSGVVGGSDVTAGTAVITEQKKLTGNSSLSTLMVSSRYYDGSLDRGQLYSIFITHNHILSYLFHVISHYVIIYDDR